MLKEKDPRIVVGPSGYLTLCLYLFIVDSECCESSRFRPAKVSTMC